MAHPKRKKSRSKRDKRRSNIKLLKPLLKKCFLTKKKHLYHHAFWQNNNLYYKGKIIFSKAK